MYTLVDDGSFSIRIADASFDMKDKLLVVRTFVCTGN